MGISKVFNAKGILVLACTGNAVHVHGRLLAVKLQDCGECDAVCAQPVRKADVGCLG